MEEVNDNYYVCNDCGALIMEEDMPRDKKTECTSCWSEDLEFFEG